MNWRQLVLIIFILGLPSTWLSSQLLFISENQELATNYINAWGDLGWHVANITTFAANPSWPLENPIYAGVTLNYPFLINLISSLLLMIGFPLTLAINLPAAVGLTATLSLIYLLTRQLTNHHLAPAIALLLIIFSGSTLGFTRLSQDLVDLAGNGADPAGWHFLNLILAGLLPQRSLLLGLPLTLTTLVLLTRPNRTLRHLFWAGICAGLLPLAHAHSALVLALTLPFLAWADQNKSKDWLIFLLPALLLGLPQIAFLLSSETAASAIRWRPGWTFQDLTGESNFLFFLFKNTGLLIPTGILAYFSWKKSQKWGRALTLAGLTLFLISHLFLFAPWAWDNYKLLIYWLILTSPGIALLLAEALHKIQLEKLANRVGAGGKSRLAGLGISEVSRLFPSWILGISAILFISLHTTTGILDLGKFFLKETPTYTEWDQETRHFAQLIQQHTQPDSLLLTAPYHNNPAALAGRQVYLGFPGHVWSHGLDLNDREDHIRKIYSGELSQTPNHSIDYLLLGPVENNRYPVALTDSWQLIASTSNYQLFAASH